MAPYYIFIISEERTYDMASINDVLMLERIICLFRQVYNYQATKLVQF
jgi:hypothetical protein